MRTVSYQVPWYVQVDELRGHADGVQVVVFGQDGSFLMSAGTDGRLLTWQ